MKVYYDGTECDLIAVTDDGYSIKGDDWELVDYKGKLYDADGNELNKDEAERGLLLEEAAALYDKLDAAGMLDDIKESDAVASITFVVMAETGQIDDVTATEHTDVFSPWAEEVEYKAGNIRSYMDKLYRCLQAHTSQADWTPDVTPSLWKAIGDPTAEWPEWSQPIGAGDEYMQGDKVSHNGKHWVSTVNYNVWEPGVYGWEEQ